MWSFGIQQQLSAGINESKLLGRRVQQPNNRHVENDFSILSNDDQFRSRTGIDGVPRVEGLQLGPGLF
jgi:hypothetical protein